MISYGRQWLNEADKAAVLEVLESDYLTQGPQVPEFEKALASCCQVAEAVAVNSATSAMHIACLALELGEGDVLWTSPNTFVASANCALYCGAQVDFVDIDPDSYNMSVEALENKLVQADKSGQLPKIVMPVHFAGQPCDMKQIHALSQKYGFYIIEDASHAVGASYWNEPVGNCRYSDICVFSFHPVKIITTAEGGVATTQSHELAEKMKLLRSHSVTRDVSMMDEQAETLDAEMGQWVYQQTGLGFNYRMTEMQAALGHSQISRLSQFVDQRHVLAQQYDELLNHLPIKVPVQSAFGRSSYHLYPIQVASTSHSRKQVFDHLRTKGIGVNVHYIPVHTQPYYQKLGFRIGDFPMAENYYRKAISLPLHPQINASQQQFVIDSLKEILT